MPSIRCLSLPGITLFSLLLSPLSYTSQADIRYSCIDFPYDNAYINTKNPTITGSLYDSKQRAVSGETVHIFLNNEFVGSTRSNDHGVYSYTLPQELADGPYVIYVSCKDSGLQIPAVIMYIDTSIPLTTVTFPEENEAISMSVLRITGTTEQDASVTVYINEDTYGQMCYADQGGAWSLDCELQDGTHTVTAQASNRAGNQGPLSNIRHFVVTILNQ